MLDCSDFGLVSMKYYNFFRGYSFPPDSSRLLPGSRDKLAAWYDRCSGAKRMLKLKDWPPEEEFKSRMVRHNQVCVRSSSWVTKGQPCWLIRL